MGDNNGDGFDDVTGLPVGGGGSSGGETKTTIVQTPTGRFIYVYDKETGELLQIQPLTDYVRPIEESTLLVGRGEYDDDDLAALYDAGRLTDTQLRNLLEGSSGGGGGGSGLASTLANIAEQRRQFDISFAEDKRQFDVSTAEGRRQFDNEYQRQIARDAAQLGLNYDELNQREKDSLRQLAYGYYNSTLDANAARQQALATLLQSKQNAATDIAQTSGNIAAQAAEFAGNPRDAISDLLYRNAVGGNTPYGSTNNPEFAGLQGGLADRFTELFGGVGKDVQTARDYLASPIPQEYMTPIVAPKVDYTPTQYTAPSVHPYQPVLNAYQQDPQAAQTFFSQKPEDLARYFGGAQQSKADQDAAAVRALAAQNYTPDVAAALQKIAAANKAKGVPGFAKGGKVSTRSVPEGAEAIRRARAGEPTDLSYGTSTTSPYGVQPAGGNVQYQRRADGSIQVVDSPVGAPGYTLNEQVGNAPGRTRPITPEEAQALSAEAFKANIDRRMQDVGVGTGTEAQRAYAYAGARPLLEADAAGVDFLTGGMKGGRTEADNAGLALLKGINPAIVREAQNRMGRDGYKILEATRGGDGGAAARAYGNQPIQLGNIPGMMPNNQDLTGNSLAPNVQRFAEGGKVTNGFDFESLYAGRNKPGYSPIDSEGGTNMNISERAIIVGESGQIYGTLGEKRPDGTIRREQLIIKPLKSEMKIDKQMEEQEKQAVESQKKTLAAFAQGGTATTGTNPSDFLTQLRTMLRGLDPQIQAGAGQDLPDPRLLAGVYQGLDPVAQEYVQSGYSSKGIDPRVLEHTIAKYRPQGLGYQPQISYR